MAASVRLAPSQVDLLNFVRAAAAQLVLFGHATFYYLNGGFISSGRLETMGVLIFFLLSGYLICSSVLQKWDLPDYRFEHFLVDRFCRIFVAYAPALVFVAAVDAPLRGLHGYPYGSSFSLGTWTGNLAMLQDFPVFQVLRRLGVPDQVWFIRPFGSGRPFWTVAIEWWIYLFFGYFAFFVLRARSLTLRGLAVLAVLGVVPIYNVIGGVGDCLSLVWATGALVAVLQHRLGRSTAAREGNRMTLGGAALCTLAVALSLAMLTGRVFITNFRVYDLQFAIFTAGALFGLLFLVGYLPVSLPRLLRRAIGFLADYSYSLYLIHYTVLIWFAVHYPSPEHRDSLTFCMVLLSANALAMLFWLAFERHYRPLALATKSALDRRRRLRTAPS